MTGTIASILRAPALEWPDELARDRTHHPEPIMSNIITLVLTRTEACALLSVVAPTGTAPVDSGERTPEQRDAISAIAKLERATRGRAA